jgi:hypothetical protein
VVTQLVADFPKKVVQLGRRALGDEFDTPIGAIADIAFDLVMAGNRAGRVTEAYALDATFKVDRVSFGRGAHG